MKITFSSEELESYRALYNTFMKSKIYKTLYNEADIIVRPLIDIVNDKESISINDNEVMLTLDTLTSIIKDIDEPLEDIISTLLGNTEQDNIDLKKDLIDTLIEVLIKDSNRRYIMTNIIYIIHMLKKYVED